MTSGTGDLGNNRRAAPRYRVRIPILFEKGDGWTRDISTTGVCFVGNLQPALGASLLYTLLFGVNGNGGGVRVNCAGHVVRVQPASDNHGGFLVAARTGDIRFRPLSA